MSGKFFAVDRSVWAKVCNLGMNQAVAYLVLACGTGRENRITRWSTTSVSKYGGIGVERSKLAINHLIQMGIIRRGDEHTCDKPRYELNLPKPRKNENGSDALIWLPNSVILETASRETPPVHRIRSSGDIWALRLLVDLYHSHNLRDDGGISPRVMWQNYDRVRLAEQGRYVVWGFKRGECRNLEFTGPFASHRERTKVNGQSHPAWQSVTILEQMGLLTFIPHIFENETQQAEVLHPYGIGYRGEEPIEREIGEAADLAARVMAAWNIEHGEQKGFDHFCPVLNTLPDVQMIGVARLLYRPHTRRTAAWFAQLKSNGQNWVTKYRELAAKSEISSSDLAKWG